MHSIGKYTVLKFFPSRQEMLNHLSYHGAAVMARFEAGRYQSLFDNRTGQAFDSEVAGWAKAYVSYGNYLERATRHAHSEAAYMLTRLPAGYQWPLDQTRLDSLQEAARCSRKTMAGVATGISRQFEDFIAEYTEATAPFPQLVKTAEQVQVMREASDAADLYGKTLTNILAEAERLDDFLLFVLAHALSSWGEGKPLKSDPQPDTAFTGYIEPAREYQRAAQAWLGRGRKTTVIAISLAVSGTTASQVRAFAESGIPREYAAVLTDRS